MKNLKEEKTITSIISNSTGEVLDELREGDSYRKTTKEQKEYLKNHELNFNKEALFVKLYDDIVPLLRERLTPTEFIFTISLAEFVCYEDCILRSNGKKNGNILNAKELADGLNMNASNVRKTISSLKKKGVIGQHETGSILPDNYCKINKAYTVNPYIFCRGSDINKVIINFYKNSGWDCNYKETEEVC